LNATARRVLFVGAFPPPERQVFGGMATSCRLLLQSSFARRVELDLLDSTQVSTPPPSLPVRAWLASRRIVRFVAQFERRRPDAVLLFAAVGGSILEKGAMAWYARLRGVPALMFPRSGFAIDDSERSWLARRWMKWAFGGARKLLCQSPRWQHFATHTLGFAPGDAPIVANWTASPELLALGKSRRPRAAAPLRLLFVGWLDREKGVVELLEACRQLAASRSFVLTCVGEGNHSQAGREFVARHGLESGVRFRGWLQGDELLAELAAADIFALPSWTEGLPNAMIEAMAAGLAVVTTRVGSIPDVVTHEREALLVPPRDRAALQAALLRLLDDAPLRARLGAAGQAMVEARFGVERAADELVAILDGLQAGTQS